MTKSSAKLDLYSRGQFVIGYCKNDIRETDPQPQGVHVYTPFVAALQDWSYNFHTGHDPAGASFSIPTTTVSPSSTASLEQRLRPLSMMTGMLLLSAIPRSHVSSLWTGVIIIVGLVVRLLSRTQENAEDVIYGPCTS